MRLLRFFLLIFGTIVLATGAVLTLTHQQSADGLWKIVFTRNTDDGWHYVEVLPTGLAIETPTSLNGNLLWSPNNEWVLFTAPSGFSESLYLSRPDGSDQRLLLDRAITIFGLTWSPDNQWLYYSDELSPRNYDLFRLRIADGHVESFGFRETVNCCRWSDDGEWMLVRLLHSDAHQSILRLRPDNSERETLFLTDTDIPFITIPEFVGQSDWIVFVADNISSDDLIYRIRADGTDLQAIGAVETTGNAPLSVTADGERMAYLSSPSATGPIQLTQLNIDGTQRDVLLETRDLLEFGNAFKLWSPDDRFMLFFTEADNSYQLAQLNMTTGELDQIYRRELSDLVSPHYLPIIDRQWGGTWWIVVGLVLVVFNLVILIRHQYVWA